MERRLTTILSADVVGYSRLMGDDEAGTLTALKTLRRELVKPKEIQYGGRTVKLMGDGALMEFASVVDAVTFAVEVQAAMAERNQEVPEDRRIVYRMGINIGDIIVEGDDIYGDGVNIAARLEGLADPGGICISRSVHTQIAGKLDLEFEDLGEQQVKNIAKPVMVYRVALDERAAALVTPITITPPTTGRGRWPQITAGIVLSVIAVSGLVWWQPWSPDVEPASVERMAFPLPDKPSIAVLPFNNLSDDPEQEYFTDGITNDIITDLSKFKTLFVIASNSTFTYKDKPVKVQQVAEDLGVRYVLEGSVQRTGDQIRINAQLIDATTGHHLWAERYDRDAEDLFAIQSEIIETIVGALALSVNTAERERVLRKSTESLDAYDYYLRGWTSYFGFSKETMAKARTLFQKAIELDPNYAQPYGFLAFVYVREWQWGWSETPDRAQDLALEKAQEAVALDPDDYYSRWALGVAHLYRQEFDRAIAEYERALALNPNDADLLAEMVEILVHMGRAIDGVAQMELAMRINPYPPDWYLWQLGWAQYFTGQYEEALAALKRMSNPPNDVRRTLAAILVRLGRLDEARSVIEAFIAEGPGVTLSEMEKYPFQHREYLDRWIEDLRKAGMPEHPPLSLPEKPSVAVLPFSNMSGDPEQDYFADGMTEDLITDLSKISGLFVIARNSSFSYKGQEVKVQQVAEELGVRYVLEGSVRRAGNEVRINAQLIDATTGGHLWAERFDGALADVFAVQDEITQRIVNELAVIVSADDNERLFRRPATNFEAYELFLRARRAWEPPTRENLARGRALFEQVIERDPKFAEGYAGLSLMHALLVQFGYSGTRDLDLDRAAQLADKALELDPGFGWAHTALGTVHLMRHKTDAAVTQARAAIRAQPGDADAHSYLGYYLQFAGRGDEAIEAVENAMRLNPRFQSGRYLAFLALAEFQARRYADAIQTIEQHFDRFDPGSTPNAILWAVLAAANHHLGHDDQARHAVEELMARFPKLAIETWGFFGLYKRPEDTEHVLGALRKLGFPLEEYQ